MRFKASVLIFILSAQLVYAQQDSITAKPKLPKGTWAYATAATFISYGVITRLDNGFQEFDRKIDHVISKNVSRRFSFDDKIQYAPHAAVYLPDLFGVKATNSILDRTLVHITAGALCFGTIQVIKRTTGAERPDGSNLLSFPSGHTANAFLGAHILYHEYRTTAPWIVATGYAIALTTGTMRIVNRKHWFSDVMTGAGVGIASVELAYLMLPVYQKIFNSKQLTISPFAYNHVVGVSCSAVF
ncbi:MAG: phosphatase PAP2 family protein [Tannerella sp.]|jgi:hypothetical protein|nr:phosphatase PAP2 family protein [Tannerella sp.]